MNARPPARQRFISLNCMIIVTPWRDFQKECERAVAAAQAVVDQKWEKLVAARQAREAVDKFLERQRERYDRELQREEQKMFDDVSHQPAFGATNWKATLQGSLN